MGQSKKKEKRFVELILIFQRYEIALAVKTKKRQSVKGRKFARI